MTCAILFLFSIADQCVIKGGHRSSYQHTSHCSFIACLCLHLKGVILIIIRKRHIIHITSMFKIIFLWILSFISLIECGIKPYSELHKFLSTIIHIQDAFGNQIFHEYNKCVINVDRPRFQTYAIIKNMFKMALKFVDLR